jgi:hypothetical protein
VIQSILLSKGPPNAVALFACPGVTNMPERHLIDEDLAAYFTGRPKSTIRRWAAEGRITRHHDHRARRNGVRYNLWELPAATRDPDTKALIAAGATPPIKDQADELVAA